MKTISATPNKKIDYWFAGLTIASGLIHLVIVSLMHRENFIELWYFTFMGTVQFALGLYALLHPEKRIRTTKILMVVHGALLTLWLFTRIMNAPFAAYPEAFGQFDAIVALLELVAVIVGARILSKLAVAKKIIAGIIVLSVILGGLNYAGAKSSENIFRSIPISTEKHGHELKSMFQAPTSEAMHDNSDGHHDNDMEAGHNNSDGHHDGDPLMGMKSAVKVPEGHDNSDGHHDNDAPTGHNSGDDHHSINTTDFKKLALSGDYTVIDVRTPQEIAGGKIIDSALEIDFYESDFAEQIAALKPDDKYLLYCSSGSRSGKTLQLMEELGFSSVLHLDGGINAWNTSGLSTSN